MAFEFDENKSNSNLLKHGIDFHTAQALWLDAQAVEIKVLHTDEQRFVVIGLLGDRHWTAVITYRNENIRIISVRRARKNEVAFYESERI